MTPDPNTNGPITPERAKAEFIAAIEASLASCEHAQKMVGRLGVAVEEDGDALADFKIFKKQIMESLEELTKCRAELAALLGEDHRTLVLGGKVLVICERSIRVCKAVGERMHALWEAWSTAGTTGRMRVFRYVAGEVRLIGVEAFLNGELGGERNAAEREIMTTMARCAERGMTAAQYVETDDPAAWLAGQTATENE